MKSYDVVIVGGGMIGLSMALCLQESELRIALIDASNGISDLSTEPELRVSALSLASQTLLQNLGAWQSILDARVQSYQFMHVWDQDSFADIHFSHKQVNLPYLGHIVENNVVRSALWRKAEDANSIDIYAPVKISKLGLGKDASFVSLDNGDVLSAKLVVGADGANSLVRKEAAFPLTFWDYDHHAIVATVKTSFPHTNTARQVFTPTGPLAFLPLYEPNLCSIVWSQEVAEAEHLMERDNTQFSQALYSAFDGKLGELDVVSERISYPLKMRYARQWVKDGVALIGDAAHTIHPLAGQGANLGFLDAAALAETVLDLHEQGKNIAAASNLRAYERWRKTEASKMIAGMEGFKRLYAGQNPVKKLIRGIGMAAVNQLPLAKEAIIQQAMGLTGKLPKMAMKNNHFA